MYVSLDINEDLATANVCSPTVQRQNIHRYLGPHLELVIVLEENAAIRVKLDTSWFAIISIPFIADREQIYEVSYPKLK